MMMIMLTIIIIVTITTYSRQVGEEELEGQGATEHPVSSLPATAPSLGVQRASHDA